MLELFFAQEERISSAFELCVKQIFIISTIIICSSTRGDRKNGQSNVYILLAAACFINSVSHRSPNSVKSLLISLI